MEKLAGWKPCWCPAAYQQIQQAVAIVIGPKTSSQTSRISRGGKSNPGKRIVRLIPVKRCLPIGDRIKTKHVDSSVTVEIARLVLQGRVRGRPLLRSTNGCPKTEEKVWSQNKTPKYAARVTRMWENKNGFIEASEP